MTRAAQLATLGDRQSAVGDACEIRRAFSGALAERLRLEPESFTRPGALARSMRRRGVSTDLALEVESFLRRLDEAAFSESGALPSEAARHAASLYAKVDDDALPRTQILARATLIVAGVLTIGAGTASAFDAVAARQAFDHGVSAYENHNFVTAREAFIAAVASDPAAPDAWADLGTASWAVADTARSVAAWQRALRIEPLASDARERVELVHALPWNSAGYVPPLPASWVFDLAAVLWLIAWGNAAYRASRGRSLGGRTLVTLGVAAGVIAVGGFALAERLSGKHLAVLRETASLSSDPGLGGERGATGIIGEVVRVSGRQGAWSRVVLDDGRDGWIETSTLVSLDTRDADQIRAN